MQIQENKNDISPMDRVETPPPAQEIHPLEQSQNDGKSKNESDIKRREEEQLIVAENLPG